jgi:hypothetical protein
MATIGTDNLVVVDGMPSVEKLWNGRVRLEFFCKPSNKNEGWYSDNIAKWLPEFGTLQGADFTGEGWAALDGEVYPNMCLVEAEVPYIPPSESHLVKLVYETLTTSWVLEKDDDTDYELNGLKRVTRQSVALPDAAYANVVGTTTIDSDGTTLYLGGYKIVETDAKWTLQEIWLEAGTLRVSEATEAEGIKKATTTFFGVEGSVVGPVIGRDTGDYEGFQTIVITSLQDKDGNALGANGDDPVSQFDQYVNFRYPGEVSVATDVDVINNATTGSVATVWNSHWYSLIPPVTSEILARVYVFFQTDDSIVASDLTYGGASGLWNPNEWAKGRVDGLGTNYGLTSVRQTAQDKVFNEYTTVSGGTNSVAGRAGYANGSGAVLVEGNYILPDASYSIAVSGGPGRPDGGTYTVQAPTLTPAFDDVDGNQVWKKVIIVATIPTR